MAIIRPGLNRIIHEFLEKSHDLNPKLRQKVLQSADKGMRAEQFLYKEQLAKFDEVLAKYYFDVLDS